MEAFLLIYYLLITTSYMGNQNLKHSHNFTCINLDILCEVVNRDYSSPYNISFVDNFPYCEELSEEICFSINSHGREIGLSSLMEEGEETEILQTGTQQEEKQLYSQNYQKSLILQKNKNQNNGKMLKNKKIKKQAHRGPKRSKEVEKSQDDLQSYSEPQQRKEDVSDYGEIRNQNNCKSYHKLVKNYLYANKLGYLIQPFEEQYYTRYYFIVALIIIKHHLMLNFTTIYQQIAEQEVHAQEKKINQKKIELARLEKQIQQFKRQNIDFQMLALKKLKLLKQIDHIQVIKNEIGNYSTQSCAAFFQGNTEESLRILYLKNDLVMKKKYYFQEALQKLKQIEIQVRKHPSHV